MRQIAEIDQDIDELKKELRALERIRPLSPASWQKAWDKNSGLYVRFSALFLERGLAQKERDEAAHKAWMRQRRSTRAA